MSDEELSVVEQIEFTGEPAAEPEGDAEPAGATGVEAKGRRGRPRSEDALGRDNAVLAALGEGVKTREQLATEINQPGGLTYLSLYRLRKEGKVQRFEGEGVKRGWQLTSVE